MNEEAVIAGIEFEENSEINTNPADSSGDGDIAWRLPPNNAFGGKDLTLIPQSTRLTA